MAQKIFRTLGFILLIVLAALQGATAAEYDLVILHGRVIDPESGLDAVRNLGIVKGRVADITQSPIHGQREIDAGGLVVAPGFIDVHAHGHDRFSQQLHAQDGVTTALELEGGVFPIGLWYRHHIGRSPINFGATVSHGVARAIAFGAINPRDLSGDEEVDSRKLGKGDYWMTGVADAAQRREMGKLIAAEFKAGGIGIGYSIAVTTGSDTEELKDLFTLAERHKKLNFIHIRSIGYATPVQAAQETIALAKATGAAVHIAHANSSGLWDTKALLALVDSAQASGVDVTTEGYPYTSAHSNFSDPRSKPEMLEAFHVKYSDLEFTETGERLTEKTYEEYRRLHPQGDLIVHLMTQENVDAVIEDRGTLVSSDGLVYQDGKGHPRSAGTFARIFSRYVRDRKTLTLAEAIAKVSYLPAKRLEPFSPDMKDRGRIRKGAVADVTIFDAARIQDRATYGDGARPSEGIAYVLVNGQPVVDNYIYRGEASPGQPIFGRRN